MIYKATHNFFVHSFFRFYSVWKTRRHFRKVCISGSVEEKNLPVLLLSNHFSWWDGFWAVYLNEKKFHRLFWFMMLEEQLRQNMFFTKTGGFSVKKGSRSILETVEYAAFLLSDKRNIVLIFPQGEIESMHTRNFIFEKGIEQIIKRTGQVQIVMLANIIDYFSKAKPVLFMYMKEYGGNDFSTEALQREYNKFYDESVSANLKMKEV